MASATFVVYPLPPPVVTKHPKFHQFRCSSSSKLPFSSSSCTSNYSLSPTRYSSFHIAACLDSSPSPTTSSNSNSTARLYVSGLSFRTTQEGLKNAFEKFGNLIEVNLVMDKIANRPRGFAFLRYTTEEESKNAIEGMHGKFLDGRVIFVEVAKPRSELRRSQNQNSRSFGRAE